MIELQPCKRCGQLPEIIELDNVYHFDTVFPFKAYFVRIRCASKCKNYKAGHCEYACKTGLYKSKSIAIKRWNNAFGIKSTNIEGQD